jgi:D-tyrosyl-tRNA(Tyr) deacylase
VLRASVTVDGETVSEIGAGLLVLLGIAAADSESDAERLADKVKALRVFADAEGRMNEPVGDREILCVSQFTLYGDTRRGNRPSYGAVAPGEQAEPLYAHFCLRRRHAGRARQRRPGDAVARVPLAQRLSS